MTKLATAFFVVLAVLSSSAGVGSVAALGDVLCPESCITTSWRPDYCFVRASIDTAVVHGRNCSDHVAYDITQGSLFAYTWASDGNCWASLTVRDDFVVTGLPVGTPVTLMAKLAVAGHYLCSNACFSGGSACEAALRPPAAAEVVWEPGCEEECEVVRDTVLTVTVPCIAETPFRMEYVVRTAALGGGGSVNATFAFDGLVPGASIRSCNGFVQDYVATRPVTWGRVKVLYR